MEELGRMLTHADQIERVYKDLLPYNGLWERLTANAPGAVRPTAESTRAGDTLTAERHLGIARGKAANPPRIAVVGGINVGKSTFLNALLHHQDIDRVLRDQFGYSGRLLKTGDDVTTGNITEIAFSGEPLAPSEDDPRTEAERFSFAVQYLSEDDLKGLFRFFSAKLQLNIPESAYSGADWIVRLKDLLPTLAKKYHSPSTDAKDSRNLRVMWEVIESVNSPNLVSLLGRAVDLGTGKSGFEKFRSLMERPKLDIQRTWEANKDKLYVGQFHLVKCLKVRMPHPEFPLPFSLHDFPGLGSGMHRDEYLSQEFIAEANLILLVFRPGMIGGEPVEHILSTFAERRRGMSAEDLLERIYFIHQGVPHNLPKDVTQVDFYLSFLKAVKNLTGSIFERKNVTPQAIRGLLHRCITHYLAFDARLADFLRHPDDNSEIARLTREEYRGRVTVGAYLCPTDPDTLKRLSHAGPLRDPTTGYPPLADMLGDARVGVAIREVFEPLQTDAGLGNMLTRLKGFVADDAPRLQAADVREHLRAAAAPLIAVDRLVGGTNKPGSAETDPYDPLQVRPLFDSATRFEVQWQEVLEVWSGGDRSKLDKNGWQPQSLDRLKQAQLAAEEQIKATIDRFVHADAFTRFKGGLLTPPEGFRNWLIALQDSTDEDDGWFSAAEETDLWLNHTLQLYRFFLKARGEVLGELYATVLPNFAQEVIGAYLESGAKDRWAKFSDVWNRVVRESESGGSELDTNFKLQTGKQKLLADFFPSVPQTIASAAWPPRKQITTLFPIGGAGECKGQFFARYGRPGKSPVRLGTSRTTEKLPRTGAQLAAWFARMRLPIGGVDLNKRQAQALPNLSETQIVRALRAVGALDPSVSVDNVTFADAKDDFWQAPLPHLTDRRVVDGVLVWNPVPFDPYAGSLDMLARNLAPSPVPVWLELIRKFLTDLFCDLMDDACRQWMGYYSNRWQAPLTKQLSAVGEKSYILWVWLAENGQRLTGDDPLPKKTQLLIETLAALRADGLLVDPAVST